MWVEPVRPPWRATVRATLDWQRMQTAAKELSRRLLKFSGGSVDSYATFSVSVTSPSC